MDRCVISMRANDKHFTPALVNTYDLDKGILNITCSKEDGMKLVSTNEHGQMIEQGYIDEPYNKEDYQINIRALLDDQSYKIYGAKIKSIAIQDTCEITFSFNLYNKLRTTQSIVIDKVVGWKMARLILDKKKEGN